MFNRKSQGTHERGKTWPIKKKYQQKLTLRKTRWTLNQIVLKTTSLKMHKELMEDVENVKKMIYEQIKILIKTENLKRSQKEVIDLKSTIIKKIY